MNGPITQLDSTLKRLHQRWEQTQSVWNDPVSRAFEQDYLIPLEQQVLVTQREMERLAQVIAQARRRVK